MEGQELREGKARVRAVLIDPLEAGGMQRRSGQKVEDHAAFLASLEARLAYMTEASLAALAEVVERHAGGSRQDRWPGEVPICNWARRIQEPPASESRLVRSYLQSGAGRAAASGGYLVELFRWLKERGVPPGDNFAMASIKGDADDNARRRVRCEEAMKRGTADPREVAWLHGYYDTLRRCEAIMEGAGA
ncbi:hypothetical protein [uncultured Maritimibacter sp.]|jgi:hypothetical protein|uniref:hypothetical protein n=1 Tax=uncultured Maritimibacter sp. TaxID=991866 RepID=UPI00261E24D4|nr:hypothetical protein [uncultured Maritimibacter sp.]